MRATNERNVLLAGPALATDKALRRKMFMVDEEGGKASSRVGVPRSRVTPPHITTIGATWP